MIKAASGVFNEPWTEMQALGQSNQYTTVAKMALNADGLQNGTGRYD
ncbi:hypothetical protein [Chryseobacterium hispalense]